MSFQDMGFLSYQARFSPKKLYIVVGISTTASPPVLKLWQLCEKGHAPSSKHLLQLILYPSLVEDNAACKTFLSLLLSCNGDNDCFHHLVGELLVGSIW